MLCTLLPVLYLSVAFHPLGGHAKWPADVNRRKAPGVIWLGFTVYAFTDLQLAALKADRPPTVTPMGDRVKIVYIICGHNNYMFDRSPIPINVACAS